MTTSETTLPPGTSVPLRPRRRGRVVVLVLFVVVLVVVVVAGRITLPYYAIVPGQAESVAALITVPKGKASTVHGQLMLTDVGVNDVKLLTVVGDLLDSDTQLVKSGDLTGNLPVSEFDDQGTVDMAESQMTAEAVALRQLGYAVPEHDAGVTVYVVDPASHAWHVLHVGDVITAVDGVPTPTTAALVAAIHTHRPGERVTLRVGSISDPSAGHDVSMTLGSAVENGKTVPVVGIGAPDVPIPGMGTQPVYDLPFPVQVSADGIGGPSAGLAFTLGIINALSGGNLTGGKRVAATGTIHPDGTVGDVGGVPQKTVAVERAGATLFLVPPQEYAAAQSKATPSLKVVAVSSLAQAMATLAHYGGSIGSAAAGPPAGPGGHSVPYDWQDAPWT
ncbi:MAG TPA: PDZ domain-containing protein [Acidimicrobiales bacterium]|nr:PDZ domain-containing protein [Acidimicrobiales bacterium]